MAKSKPVKIEKSPHAEQDKYPDYGEFLAVKKESEAKEKKE